MSVTWIMQNGDEVIVPPEVLTQGDEAIRAFFDNQVRRVEMEAAEDATARRPRRKDAES